MRDNREIVQGWIGLSEGGYVNHPKDPGGATDRGITQATYNAYLRRKGMSQRPVKGISKAVAEEIIYEQYMRPIWFDELPAGLDYAMADYAVNSGPARAVKEIQRIVKVTADGVMGNKTLAAIKARPTEDLIFALCAARMRFLRGLRTFSTFGRGWTTRVVGRQEGFQANDIGVLDRAVKMHRAYKQPTQHKVVNIEAPVAAGPQKANPDDVADAAVMKDLVKDPLAAVPVIGALAPMLSGTGPVQIAIAVVLVMAAGYILFTRLKKEKGNA